jgi:NAD-dependent SIR2 family protein deacetylase
MCSHNKNVDDQIKRAAHAIDKADAVLIAAGAGIGVDSGLSDYRGTKGFWNSYQGIGKSSQSFIELSNVGQFDDNPQLAWAFYGQQLNQYRAAVPHVGFSHLLEISKEKTQDYFVLTSNVDGQFQKAGFPDEKIEEIHGSFHYLQCSQPCCDEIWRADSETISIDEEKFLAIGDLPICNRCDSVSRPNVLMFYDGSWIGNRTDKQEENFWFWLENLKDCKTVIIEIGAGTVINTIRQRTEYYADLLFTPLIRINPHDYHVAKDRHISVPMGALDGIERICSQLN